MPVFVRASKRAKQHYRKSSIGQARRTESTYRRLFRSALRRSTKLSPARIDQLDNTLRSINKARSKSIQEVYDKMATGRQLLKKTRNNMSFKY